MYDIRSIHKSKEILALQKSVSSLVLKVRQEGMVPEDNAPSIHVCVRSEHTSVCIPMDRTPESDFQSLELFLNVVLQLQK